MVKIIKEILRLLTDENVSDIDVNYKTIVKLMDEVNITPIELSIAHKINPDTCDVVRLVMLTIEWSDNCNRKSQQ